MINSTFAGNTAPGGFGGGLYNLEGTVTVINSTFSGNSALAGGIYTYQGTVMLRNTLVANNTSDNCAGTDFPTDGGHNLDSGTTCGFSSLNGSLSDTNPLLNALGNNGGPTHTMALSAGSPAINAGDNDSVPVGLTWDQRGNPYSRIVDSIVDIGAYEYVPGPTAPTNVEATAGPGWISVVFGASTGTGTVNYTATCTSSTHGAATPRTASGTNSPIVVTGATAGASYLCSVVATDSTGSSPAASAINGAVTPTAPPTPSNPIPTLNEWAQMAMMLLMLVTAGWYGRKMKQQ